MSTEARAGLVIAHPGHEILLHHWMEQTQPIVWVLTDGAGGSGSPRLDHSRRLIEKTGATCGGTFGIASDRIWYDAILNNDAAPFLAAIDRIEVECAAAGVRLMVCDPVELFNPMHDLANVVAHAVAARQRRTFEVLTYPIEDEGAFHARRSAHVPLNTEASARKRAAIAAYRPLAHEVPRYLDLARRGHETLAPDTPSFAWPRRLAETPYYERFGRERLAERRYDTLITYADHVRPIALELLEQKRMAA